jgi:voltage-gated potassium channel
MSLYRVQEPTAARRQLRVLRRRFLAAISLLTGLIALSTAVFATLDGSGRTVPDRLWSGLWNSMNVFSTLGDLEALSPAGRTWAMVMMAAGVSIAAFGLSTLTAILTGSDFRVLHENRRMERTLERLSGHLVVIGYDEFGSRLAAELARQGRPTVVIERDPAAADRAVKAGLLVVEGEGTDEAALRAAGIDRADSVFVATFDPQPKLIIVLTAREIAASTRIVAIARDEAGVRLLRRAGATVALDPAELIIEAIVARLPAKS